MWRRSRLVSCYPECNILISIDHYGFPDALCRAISTSWEWNGDPWSVTIPWYRPINVVRGVLLCKRQLPIVIFYAELHDSKPMPRHVPFSLTSVEVIVSVILTDIVALRYPFYRTYSFLCISHAERASTLAAGKKGKAGTGKVKENKRLGTLMTCLKTFTSHKWRKRREQAY